MTQLAVTMRDIHIAQRMLTCRERADEYERLAERAAYCHKQTGSEAQKRVSDQLYARAIAERNA